MIPLLKELKDYLILTGSIILLIAVITSIAFIVQPAFDKKTDKTDKIDKTDSIAKLLEPDTDTEEHYHPPEHYHPQKEIDSKPSKVDLDKKISDALEKKVSIPEISPKPVKKKKTTKPQTQFNEFIKLYWKYHVNNECRTRKSCCNTLKGDLGGLTCYGSAITKNPGTFHIFKKIEPIFKRDRKIDSTLFEPIAQEIFFRNYYKKPRIVDIKDKALRFAVYDYSVHSGPPRAIRYFQKVCGVKVDGILGKNSLAKCQKVDPFEYLKERTKFIHSLKQYKSGLFKNGWDRRLRVVKEEILELQQNEKSL